MFITEYKQLIKEGFDVEGGGHGTPPSYDESNAVQSSAPPQNPYPPPNSLEYPMKQPSHSQQAAQLPQQQPGTYAPQLQEFQVKHLDGRRERKRERERERGRD